MKFTFYIVLAAIVCFLAFGFVSCMHPLDRHTRTIEEAKWELNDTPNPLDSPANSARTNWHSPAWGTFGPGGDHTPYRPELNQSPQ